MPKTKLLLASLAAASAFAAIPLTASAAIGLYVDIAPPPPRHEAVPAPRPGYVWDQGYWDRRDGRYVWVKGHWIHERHGMHWHPSHWAKRDGRWELERGNWSHEG
ncbi:MAG TPA: YXWGXW repeat-containing protein [Usitatibacter sp.]|nr:YXWGXW repeat-containing protein [Usitatibacter sp.]